MTENIRLFTIMGVEYTHEDVVEMKTRLCTGRLHFIFVVRGRMTGRSRSPLAPSTFTLPVWRTSPARADIGWRWTLKQYIIRHSEPSTGVLHGSLSISLASIDSIRYEDLLGACAVVDED